MSRCWLCQFSNHSSPFTAVISPAAKWQVEELDRVLPWGKRAAMLASPDFFTKDQVLTVTFFSTASRYTWWEGRKALCKKASSGIPVLEQCPKELGVSWGRNATYLSVDKGPCSPAQLKSNIQAGWREQPTSSGFWLLQPWLLQQLSTGRYSGRYNWASLQAFIWHKWGSSSVPQGVGFLWEMWIADFNPQHVRAAGLCWGCKQPVQLHSDN